MHTNTLPEGTTAFIHAYVQQDDQRLVVEQQVFRDADEENPDAGQVSSRELLSITREGDAYVARVPGLLEPIRDAACDRVLARALQALEGVQDQSLDALRRNVSRVLPPHWR